MNENKNNKMTSANESVPFIRPQVQNTETKSIPFVRPQTTTKPPTNTNTGKK
jgi:hypothetical protein